MNSKYAQKLSILLYNNVQTYLFDYKLNEYFL